MLNTYITSYIIIVVCRTYVKFKSSESIVHIVHHYIDTLFPAQVPLGIIPKNEAKREELTCILEQLHEYVPSPSSDHDKIVPVSL